MLDAEQVSISISIRDMAVAYGIDNSPTMIDKSQFEIEKTRIIGDDILALYLLRGK